VAKARRNSWTPVLNLQGIALWGKPAGRFLFAQEFVTLFMEKLRNR
jgi:hypothetical protein